MFLAHWIYYTWQIKAFLIFVCLIDFKLQVCKELDTTERLNWTELKLQVHLINSLALNAFSIEVLIELFCKLRGYLYVIKKNQAITKEIKVQLTHLLYVYPHIHSPEVTAVTQCLWNTIKQSQCVCVCARVHAQSCPTLFDPKDCSPPGSFVHRIFQARILEWVAISFSRGSSQPRNRLPVFK